MDNNEERAKYLGRFMSLTEMFAIAVNENNHSLIQILKKQADDALNDYNSYLQSKNISDKLRDLEINREDNS